VLLISDLNFLYILPFFSRPWPFPCQGPALKLGALSGAADMDREGLDETCLKWGADGELSPVDQQRILQRLMAQDPAAHGLMDCRFDDGAAASGYCC
jgi:hypothetical protein